MRLSLARSMTKLNRLPANIAASTNVLIRGSASNVRSLGHSSNRCYRPELDTRRESRNRKQSGDGPRDAVKFKSRPNPVPTHGPHPPNRMAWTPPPQGKSNAPTLLKTSLTPLYRLLCGLLVLGALVLIVMQVFDIPVPFDTPRTFSLFVLAGACSCSRTPCGLGFCACLSRPDTPNRWHMAIQDGVAFSKPSLLQDVSCFSSVRCCSCFESQTSPSPSPSLMAAL